MTSSATRSLYARHMRQVEAHQLDTCTQCTRVMRDKPSPPASEHERPAALCGAHHPAAGRENCRLQWHLAQLEPSCLLTKITSESLSVCCQRTLLQSHLLSSSLVRCRPNQGRGQGLACRLAVFAPGLAALGCLHRPNRGCVDRIRSDPKLSSHKGTVRRRGGRGLGQ